MFKCDSGKEKTFFSFVQCWYVLTELTSSDGICIRLRSGVALTMVETLLDI